MTKGKFNPQRGDVEVTVGDAKITLRYTLRSLAIIQEKLGDRFNELLNGNREQLGDMRVIETLIDAGMRYHHGADHGIDVLGEASGHDVERLMQGFIQAFTAAFPKQDGKPAADGSPGNPPAPASTSTS